MVKQLAISNTTAALAFTKTFALPALIAAAGARASYRFLEFFTANLDVCTLRRRSFERW
jgi:hypothetical protein